MNTFASTIKKTKKLIMSNILGLRLIFVLLLVTTASLFSCNGIDNDETVEKNNFVTIRIAVGESSRTAYPQLTNLDVFNKFELVCDGKLIGRWKVEDEGVSAYSAMNADSITVEVGTHEFELNAIASSGISFKGNQTVDVQSSITLNFELAFADTGNSGSSDVYYDITVPSNSPFAESVNYVELKRYKYESFTSRVVSQTVDKGRNDENPIVDGDNIRFFNGVSDWMKPGKYLYECNFYTGSRKNYVLIGTVQEIVYVVSGFDTTLKISVSDFDDIYKISYENIWGISSGSFPLYYTCQSETILPQPEKTGYNFDGWYTQADENGNGTGTKLTGWAAGEKAEDITLYAKWTRKTYTVQFYTDLYGENEQLLNPAYTQIVEYRKIASFDDSLLEKTGYSFVGWVSEKSNKDFVWIYTKQITEDLNFYAVWQYKVFFEKNAEDATGTMDAQEMSNCLLGLDNTVLTKNSFERAGYTFLGWAKSPDATEATYTDGADSAGEISAETTLYAVWHDDSTGTVVTFDYKDGSPLKTQEVPVGA